MIIAAYKNGNVLAVPGHDIERDGDVITVSFHDKRIAAILHLPDLKLLINCGECSQAEKESRATEIRDWMRDGAMTPLRATN